MPPKKDLPSGLIQQAKDQEAARERKNWFTSLPAKNRAEIVNAAKQVVSNGVTLISLAKVVKTTFKIDRSPAHIARVLRELAEQ
jgi:hypothetical protein